MSDDVPIVPVVTIDSPCVNLCRMNPATELCEGCARTIAEIMAWGNGTQEWRDAVMRELPGRRFS